MTDKDYGNSLMKETYEWLESWEPAKNYRAAHGAGIKTVVLTETTTDSSTLLSLKTELADTKKELDKRTYELGCMTRDYNNLKKEVGVLSASFRALYEQLTK
jgi:hypothetical protein